MDEDIKFSDMKWYEKIVMIAGVTMIALIALAVFVGVFILAACA